MNEFMELLPVVLSWGMVVFLGGVVGGYAARLFLRERQRAMGFLAIGFVFVSAGAAFAWFATYFAGLDLITCEIASTSFAALGFGSILYSLRIR